MPETQTDTQPEQLLLGCCGSRRWAALLAAGWPYRDLGALQRAADAAFDSLDRDDWLEAFSAHARIGEPRAGDEMGAAEQSGVSGAADHELRELAVLGADYDRRFGHVFLICATGLTTAELLGALRRRLSNTAAEEFEIATGEQRKITALRLVKSFGA